MKSIRKKYRKIEVINIESHIWKQEQDNKLIQMYARIRKRIEKEDCN